MAVTPDGARLAARGYDPTRATLQVFTDALVRSIVGGQPGMEAYGWHAAHVVTDGPLHVVWLESARPLHGWRAGDEFAEQLGPNLIRVQITPHKLGEGVSVAAVEGLIRARERAFGWDPTTGIVTA